jgi:protein phosphatase
VEGSSALDALFPHDYSQGNANLASQSSVEIVAFSHSHTGKVRKDNQDAIKLCDYTKDYPVDIGYVFGIADGMGGYAHGGVASTIALQTFFETFYEANGAAPQQKIKIGIQNANLTVYQTAQRMAAGRMGTTLTVVNLVGRRLHIGHVGDSRAYLIRKNVSTLLTTDHTRVGELVRMKLLAPEKIRTHSQRSVLERSLGIGLFVQPDIFSIPVQEQDIIMLCTDGLWSVIEDQEFADLINKAESLEVLCPRLIDLAMDRESDDNLSIVLISLNKLLPDAAPGKTGTGKLKKILKRFSLSKNKK